VEHWFDRLSRPHTRRSALQAALGVAAAGVAAPALRPPLAYATDREPCFQPCMQAAAVRANASHARCEQLAALAHVDILNGSHAPDDVLVSILDAATVVSCLASAQVTLHFDVLGCRDAECGNEAKYPGGKVAPPPTAKPKCDPKEEIACGDTCCYTFNKCCPNPNAPGGYSCWAAHHVC
jgi:hypothetical protein